jgi:hypothetical protein
MTIKERVQEVFNKFNVNLTAEEVLRVDMAEAALENGTVIYTDGEDFAEGEEAYIINDEGERIPLPPGDYTLADGGVISIGDLGKVNKVTKPAGGDAKNEGKPDAKGIDGKPNIDSTKPTKPKEAPAAPPARDPAPKDPPKKVKKKLASEEEQQNDMKVEFNQEEVLAVLNERFPDLGEELAQAIAAAVAEVYAKPEEEVIEEEAQEEEKEEMTETTEATEEVAEEIEVEVEMSEQKPEKTELESLKEALAETNAKLEELQKFAAEPGLKHKAPAKKVEKLDLSKMTIEERVRALANQLSK